MRKKIALFIIGAVLSIGTFLIYQHLTGATFSSNRKPVPTGGAGLNADRPPTFETRRPNGDLEQVLSAKKVTPSKDASGNPIPGQYDLTEPNGSYYTDDGKLVFIRSDTGVMSVDESAAGRSGGKPLPKGGHLSGHVVLTYGPQESFTGTSLDLQPGQLQVRFEQDLDLNYAEQLLTSPGLVHLRSDQLEFDGENLTIAFNRGMKRIELLRIDPLTGSGKSGYMLIKNIGREALGMDQFGLPTEQTASTPVETGLPGKSRRDRNTPAQPAAPAPAPGTSANHKCRRRRAATNPAPEGTHELQALLRQKRHRHDGAQLAYQRSAVRPLFPGKSRRNKGRKYNRKPVASTAPATTNPGGHDRFNPAANNRPATATTSPGNSTAAATFAPPDRRLPSAATTSKCGWTGPMEMRPTTDTDLRALVDRHDAALEALGTAERPVIAQGPNLLRDGRPSVVPSRPSASASSSEPNGLPNVLATNVDPAHPTFGTSWLMCQGLELHARS